MWSVDVTGSLDTGGWYVQKGDTGDDNDYARTRNLAPAFRALGRLLLWTVLIVVLVRGLSDILGDRAAVISSPARLATTARFPDDEARTFAARFARLYVTSLGDDRERALRPYLTNDLRDHATAKALQRGSGAQVAWAMVAREASLGGSRALVTVAILLTDGRSRYLTVPVGRDSRGGLSVFDLPSVSPPPPSGDVSGDSRAPLTGVDAGPISDVVERFLRAYLVGGGAAELAYYIAPGARITQMPRGLRVVGVDGLDQLGGQDGPARVVVASVRARDVVTGGEYPLRYRLRLVRRDRWYVADMAGGPGA
jgi:hypothetical protein